MTDAEILERIPETSALVIGDICLDRWCRYDPDLAEPSRETGIPRTGVIATEVTAGAGGTVANNLAALGAGRVAVLGAIGEDGFGWELANALTARGISPEYLVKVPGLQTFTYTKVINARTGIEDRPRLDFVSNRPLDAATERKILDTIVGVFDLFDAILISDQAEKNCGGVITPAVRALLADLAPNYPDKIVLVDSRNHIAEFRRVTVKPNRQEAEEACGALFGRVDYQALRNLVDTRLMIVTDGPEGATVVDRGGEQRVRTRPVENPVDICGAGDSFSAGAALALSITRSAVRAAEFGNRVASITIMKPGTGTASPAEVRSAGP